MSQWTSRIWRIPRRHRTHSCRGCGAAYCAKCRLPTMLPPDLVMIVRLSAKRNALAIGPRLCCSTIASFRSCARLRTARTRYSYELRGLQVAIQPVTTAILTANSKRHRRAQRLTHVVNDWRRLVCSILFAIRIASGSMSRPMAVKPRLDASRRTVPEPHIGSQTIPPTGTSDNALRAISEAMRAGKGWTGRVTSVEFMRCTWLAKTSENGQASRESAGESPGPILINTNHPGHLPLSIPEARPPTPVRQPLLRCL